MNHVQKALKVTEEYLFNFSDVEKGDNVWGTVNDIEVDDLACLFQHLVIEGVVPHTLNLHYTQSNNEYSYEDMSSRVIVFDGLDVVTVMYFDELIVENNGHYRGLSKEGMTKLINQIFEIKSDFEEKSSEYPVFKQGEEIEIKVAGQGDPIKVEFDGWQQKPDRPNGAFLLAVHDGVKRAINDLFIRSLNGQPFEPLEQ
ncbi:hypothetical protein J2S74_002952 [Evansella vedderi]|uniref:Uncharacterized protein n=1 Tax=Evansella vedderi TaxID=38282 RepID=A0ABT9ZWH0_9BACI|nr:hypothetical protein [Evansella vedderi]MDQ0255570.1 hypothetical protein [Evansella vedderi]